MEGVQFAGNATLTDCLANLADALSKDHAVSDDTRQAAELLRKCLKVMDECESLIVTQG